MEQEVDRGVLCRSRSYRGACVFSLFCLTLSPSPPLPPQIPSAGQLMEAVRVKMKERKALTEELAMLAQPVSEKA